LPLDSRAQPPQCSNLTLGKGRGMDHIRGILFDKDGTLFDFQTTWGAWSRRFFTELADGDEALASNIAGSLGFSFADNRFDPGSIIIAGTPGEVAAAVVAVFPRWPHAAMVDHINRVAAEVPQAEPVPLVPLLEGFRVNGLKIGLATNDSETPARAHLGRAGITHLFDFIAGFDSGYGAKPEPGMQLGFCAATGLAPGQVMMVGDSHHDLISGRAAGMMTVGVLTGLATADDLSPLADVVLNHIGELPTYLGQS
jgi:phosphoglycolate phosphatase